LEPMGLQATSHVFRLTVVVHPGYLDRGIGAELMRDLLEWAEQTPRVGKIELLVRATNERAIRLYSKLGFVEEGRFRNRVRLQDGSFVDDIAMAWFPDGSTNN
jgi:ribosomal protein S18 acetylase RimI-like enzyme